MLHVMHPVQSSHSDGLIERQIGLLIDGFKSEKDIQGARANLGRSPLKCEVSGEIWVGFLIGEIWAISHVRGKFGSFFRPCKIGSLFCFSAKCVNSYSKNARAKNRPDFARTKNRPKFARA